MAKRITRHERFSGLHHASEVDVASALSTLMPREERVIRMRFGIGDGREYALKEVGEIFLVTRERIRQIEAKALRKLCHISRRKLLAGQALAAIEAAARS